MSNSKLELFSINVSVILAVAMFLVIPNLHVYSAIGSYQTLSQAIIANNNYKKSSARIEKSSALIGGGGLLVGTFAVIIGMATVAVVSGTAALALAAVGTIQPNSVFIKNDQNYDRRNFSQFDNYTPSSMKPQGS